MSEKTKIRRGRWNSTEVKRPDKVEEIPESVREMFENPDGDWDWLVSYTPEGWIVVRLYDEGVEVERMICRIVKRRDLGEW